MIRDKNGEFEIEDLPVEQYDEQEDGGGGGEAGEDESMFSLWLLAYVVGRGMYGSRSFNTSANMWMCRGTTETS